MGPTGPDQTYLGVSHRSRLHSVPLGAGPLPVLWHRYARTPLCLLLSWLADWFSWMDLGAVLWVAPLQSRLWFCL